jgi:hypothetical protein
LAHIARWLPRALAQLIQASPGGEHARVDAAQLGAQGRRVLAHDRLQRVRTAARLRALVDHGAERLACILRQRLARGQHGHAEGRGAEETAPAEDLRHQALLIFSKGRVHR